MLSFFHLTATCTFMMISIMVILSSPGFVQAFSRPSLRQMMLPQVSSQSGPDIRVRDSMAAHMKISRASFERKPWNMPRHMSSSSSSSSSSESASTSTSSSSSSSSSTDPEAPWREAVVVSNVDACTSGTSVVMLLQVPSTVAEQYTLPGQYVQLALPLADPASSTGELPKPIYLAMASPPPSAENADPVFEFLIKKTDGNAWLTNLNAGATLQVSAQVMGKGFALEENIEGFKYDFPTQNILLCASGAGIAPIKAVMESGVLRLPEFRRTCRLYYGERAASDLCYVDRFAAWEQAGMEVVPVLSQPELDDEDPTHRALSWQGRTGYVQTALEEDGIAIPRNSAALLCGVKGMTDAVKTLLVQAGVFPGRILFNY